MFLNCNILLLLLLLLLLLAIKWYDNNNNNNNNTCNIENYIAECILIIYHLFLKL